MTITAKYKSISNVSVTIQASPEKGGKVKYNSDPAVSSENICVHGLSKQRLELCRLEEGWRYDFLQEQKTTVADESVTYVGVFEKDKNYRATTDLVDEHFYNDKRSFTEPPEEFDGLVRTYLWKETGAQKGNQ